MRGMMLSLSIVALGVLFVFGAQETGETEPVIMMEDVDDWHVDWFVGGPGAGGFVQGPREQCSTGGALVFDSKGNGYIACGTYVVMIPKEGPVRIISGTPGVKGATDGPPWKATFSGARDIDIHNDVLYFLESGNLTVRKLENRDDVWHAEIVAGVPGEKGHRDGPAREALFEPPFDGLAVDENGVIYILSKNWLKKIENGTVTTLNAGDGRNDGPLHQAGFSRAMGGGHSLTYDGEGNLYVADRWNHAVRKVNLRAKEVSTVAGVPLGEKKGPPTDGPALAARFHPGGGPCQIYFNRTYKFLLLKVADERNRIRWIKDGKVRTFSGFAGKKQKKPSVGPLRSIGGGGVCGFDAEGNVYLRGPGGIQVARKKGGE